MDLHAAILPDLTSIKKKKKITAINNTEHTMPEEKNSQTRFADLKEDMRVETVRPMKDPFEYGFMYLVGVVGTITSIESKPVACVRITTEDGKNIIVYNPSHLRIIRE